MTECPYCTHRVESMGYREGSNDTKRRFRCLNPECRKSHTRDAQTNELLVPKEAKMETFKKYDKTVNITGQTKERLMTYKICAGEMHDELIVRILNELDERRTCLQKI